MRREHFWNVELRRGEDEARVTQKRQVRIKSFLFVRSGVNAFPAVVGETSLARFSPVGRGEAFEGGGVEM